MKNLHKLIKEERHDEAYQTLCDMDTPRVPVVLRILTRESREHLIEASEPILTELMQDGEYEVEREDVERIDMTQICDTASVANSFAYLIEAMALDMCDNGSFQARLNEIEQDAIYTADLRETERSMMGAL